MYLILVLNDKIMHYLSINIIGVSMTLAFFVSLAQTKCEYNGIKKYTPAFVFYLNILRIGVIYSLVKSTILNGKIL